MDDAHPRADRQPSVLLVDDDPVTQTQLARALGESGARVVGTGSGDAALALLEQWPAGVVVLSDAMPGGLEVARRIHASSPGVPIVLVSDRAKKDEQEHETEARALAARLAGVFATLTRPFDRRVLAELVVALVVASDALA